MSFDELFDKMYECMVWLICMDARELIMNLGFSEKAARVYVASLELGEATVQELAKQSKLKRTTVYYVLSELTERGALLLTKRNKKWYYLPAEPREVIKRSRERFSETEAMIEVLESRKHAIYPRPRIYFLYGPMGFKQIWDMVFKSKEKEFLITTSGESFLDYVKEKYIIDEIIRAKRKLGITSRQLIVDSPYARKIVAKDKRENRVSKLLSARYKLPFSEVICKEFVAFASPRYDNVLLAIENETFATTRRHMFNMLWDALPIIK